MRLFLIFSLFSVFVSCNDGQNTSREVVSDTEVPTREKEEKKTLVFFGNSLTAGYGLDISESFPARIQEIIDSLDMGYRVINAGLSGETTASGNSRIEWVLKNEIDVFVLELGANDGLRGIPTDETEKNLQEIIDKVQKKYPDVKIVLAGMMVPPNMGEKYSRAFQEIFPGLAKKNKLPLIPFLLEGVAGEPDLNLDDGIHPTSKGHKMVAQNVWNTLQDVL